MAQVGKPELMPEIPEPDFHRIVKLLLDGHAIAPDKILSGNDILIRFKERIAYADELKLMAEALLKVKLKPYRQPAARHEQGIGSQGDALKFISARNRSEERRVGKGGR